MRPAPPSSWELVELNALVPVRACNATACCNIVSFCKSAQIEATVLSSHLHSSSSSSPSSYSHGFQSRPAASRRAVNSKFHTLTGFATLWRITLTGKMLPLSSLQDVSPTIVFEHMQTSYGIHSVDCQTWRSLIHFDPMPEVATGQNLGWLRLVLTTPCDGWTSRCEDVLKLLQSAHCIDQIWICATQDARNAPKLNLIDIIIHNLVSFSHGVCLIFWQSW